MARETVADIVVSTLAAIGLRNIYCEFVSIPAQVPRVLDMAIQIAIFRQGVSVIVLPQDVALQAASDLPLPSLARPIESIASPDTAELH